MARVDRGADIGRNEPDATERDRGQHGPAHVLIDVEMRLGTGSEPHGRDPIAVRRQFWDRIPFGVHCGMAVADWTSEAVSVSMSFGADVCNGSGGLHGGAVSALIDHTATAAVIGTLELSSPLRPVTVSMSVNYLASTKSSVVARATVTRAGRQIHFVHVIVTDEDDRAIAEGLATITLVRRAEG